MRSGTVVQPHMLGVDYNPKIFDKPFEFMPERWLDQEDRPEVIRFGISPRSCLGRQLATIASKITLIKIMKRYKKI